MLIGINRENRQNILYEKLTILDRIQHSWTKKYSKIYALNNFPSFDLWSIDPIMTNIMVIFSSMFSFHLYVKMIKVRE